MKCLECIKRVRPMARESDSMAREQWSVEPSAYSSEDLGVGCAEHGN